MANKYLLNKWVNSGFYDLGVVKISQHNQWTETHGQTIRESFSEKPNHSFPNCQSEECTLEAIYDSGWNGIFEKHFSQSRRASGEMWGQRWSSMVTLTDIGLEKNEDMDITS